MSDDVMIAAARQLELGDLARRLAAAWRTADVMAPLAGDEMPHDRTEAYFVQDQMAMALGEPASGWKVGATSARLRELDGHDDVIPGRIFKRTTWFGSEIALPMANFPDVRAETEFAFRITQDLPLNGKSWTAEAIRPFVVAHPAIEIIGNRHTPPGHGRQRSLMTIADNGGGVAFVFGDAVSDWQDVDFQNHHISLTVDGGPAAENFLGEMRGAPLQATADLANHLAARGYTLVAGDFVSTGAATVPQPVKAGSRVIADFGHLGSIKVAFQP